MCIWIHTQTIPLVIPYMKINSHGNFLKQKAQTFPQKNLLNISSVKIPPRCQLSHCLFVLSASSTKYWLFDGHVL